MVGDTRSFAKLILLDDLFLNIFDLISFFFFFYFVNSFARRFLFCFFLGGRGGGTSKADGTDTLFTLSDFCYTGKIPRLIGLRPYLIKDGMDNLDRNSEYDRVCI